MANQNNELEVFSFLSECVLPSQKIILNGGNTSNSADLIVVDLYDPKLKQIHQSIKAHYVIAGNYLYLHDTNIDPWNVARAMQKLDMPVETIKDKDITITKRSSGATRIAGGSGALRAGDTRSCSLGIRFWPSYPDLAIDLSDDDHRDILFNEIFNIQTACGFTPHVTIDAKMDHATQYVGPNILAKRIDGSLELSFPGADPDRSQFIIDHMSNDPILKEKFFRYLDFLNVDQSTFKVIADDSEQEGVPEFVYNMIKFYHTFPDANFNLSSTTFQKTVPIKIGEFIDQTIQQEELLVLCPGEESVRQQQCGV